MKKKFWKVKCNLENQILIFKSEYTMFDCLIILILSFRRHISRQNYTENTAFPFLYLAQNGDKTKMQIRWFNIIIIIIIYEWNNAALIYKLMKPFLLLLFFVIWILGTICFHTSVSPWRMWRLHVPERRSV